VTAERPAFKRTTVTLRPTDKDNLAALVALLGGVSDMEAIRRSLEVAVQVLSRQRDGWAVKLRKGRSSETVRFL
jgi:hypothetical protein